MRIISSCLITLLGSAGSVLAAEKVTYVDHVLPIFRNSCLNCHNPDKKKAGLDLTTYGASLMGSENGKVINPGNADASQLFKCILPGGDPKMPPKGDRLTDAEVAVIKNWIAGFALENATGKPAAAAQNTVALAVVSLTKPDGPPPMPGDLPLEPVIRTRATNALTALAASPWAPLVALGGQKQIVLYNTENLQTIGVLPFPEGFPTIIHFSRNGQLLLTGGGLGGKSGKVVLWNVLTGERSGTIGDEVDQVLAADISPDQAHVALGGPTKVLKIYSTKDGKLEQTIKKHTDWVTAVAFSPEGKYLASADRNGGIVVWEGATGKEFNVLAGHKSMVTALAFMPGVLASAGEDGKITLWDVKEGKEIRTWDGHPGGVESVDFTPDGRLVSCGRDKVAKVWTQDGKVTTTSAPLGDIALRAVLSNERVIAGDWSGRVSVFGLDGKPVGELSANPPPIADQLAAAQKAFADAQAACGPLQQAVTAAEAKLKAEKDAAEAKRVADLAAAQQQQKDAQAAIAAAQPVVPALEKQLADATAQITALRQTRDAA
jgi:mono/diheme cytochrome c family protein